MLILALKQLNTMIFKYQSLSDWQLILEQLSRTAKIYF